MSEQPTQRLAGTQPEEVAGRLAGAGEVALQPRRLAGGGPVSASAPLAAPATTATLASRRLTIVAARKSGVFDTRTPIVGMRTTFVIDFYDIRTKLAVSPVQVVVRLVDKAGNSSSVALAENPQHEGRYEGSFVPQISGIWKASVVAGTTPEVMDERTFVVAGRRVP